MTIEDHIYNVLEKLLPTNSFKIIIEGSNGAEPKSAYVMISRITKQKIGQAYKTYSTTVDDIREYVTQTYEYTMSLTFHMRPEDIESDEIVETFNLGLASSHYVFTFANEGLSLVRHNNLNSLILPVDGTVNYKRLIQDIVVRTNQTKAFHAEEIREVFTFGDLQTTDFESHVILRED